MAELTLNPLDRGSLSESFEYLVAVVLELERAQRQLELVRTGEDLTPLVTVGSVWARCPVLIAQLKIARNKIGELLDRAEMVSKVGAGHVPR